jgi:hypothetical protein
VTISGAAQVIVSSLADVESVAARGQAKRAVGSTKSNSESSRSHMVLMIDVELREKACLSLNEHGEVTEAISHSGQPSSSSGRLISSGRISLVDLAGSERIAKSEASGAALTEAKHINKSLSALIDVICALSDREKKEKAAAAAAPGKDKASSSSKERDAPGAPMANASGAPTRRGKAETKATAAGAGAAGAGAAAPAAATAEPAAEPEAAGTHIPFRNSKLTHLLMGSLKPGSKLAFIAQVRDCCSVIVHNSSPRISFRYRQRRIM